MTKETKLEEEQDSSYSSESSQEIKKDEKITNAEITFPNPENQQKNKIEQDPTRFGDWQINGRAIDF
jgi:hypothetical protein